MVAGPASAVARVDGEHGARVGSLGVVMSIEDGPLDRRRLRGRRCRRQGTVGPGVRTSRFRVELGLNVDSCRAGNGSALLCDVT